MRSYAKVAPTFWTGPTGKAIKESGRDAQVLALYLLTSPHANMLGLYYLPIPFICHETGLSDKGAYKALQRLYEGGFCTYDPASEHVWVYEMARFQIGEYLEGKDNRVKGVNSEYQSLPKNPFLGDFFDKYAEAFHLEERRGSEGPSKGLRSQEQEQEQEFPPVVPPEGDANVSYGYQANQVFSYWCERLGKGPQTKFTRDRRRKIEARLKEGYSVEDLKAAVDGITRSPHHMGENEQGIKYDDLELICRKGSKVEHFMGLASKPASNAPAMKEL